MLFGVLELPAWGSMVKTESVVDSGDVKRRMFGRDDGRKLSQVAALLLANLEIIIMPSDWGELSCVRRGTELLLTCSPADESSADEAAPAPIVPKVVVKSKFADEDASDSDVKVCTI